MVLRLSRAKKKNFYLFVTQILIVKIWSSHMVFFLKSGYGKRDADGISEILKKISWSFTLYMYDWSSVIHGIDICQVLALAALTITPNPNKMLNMVSKTSNQTYLIISAQFLFFLCMWVEGRGWRGAVKILIHVIEWLILCFSCSNAMSHLHYSIYNDIELKTIQFSNS